MKIFLVTLFGKDQSYGLTEAEIRQRLISYLFLEKVKPTPLARMVRYGTVGTWPTTIKIDKDKLKKA